MAATLMPSHLRFIAVADDRGSRPVRRSLEAGFVAWLRRAQLTDVPEVDDALARSMASEVRNGKRLVVALVGGAGEYRFTHYERWQPDYSWSGVAEWEARLELKAETSDGFAQVLAKIVDWLRVPDPYAGRRSVLVACPERDIVDGTWWKYAIGSRGAPMPMLEIGEPRFAEEVFRATGASAARAPTLREFSGAKKHFFAIDDGPAGLVSFADTDGVGWGSGFLDRLDAGGLSRQHELLAAEGWPDVDYLFDRLNAVAPRMRAFYNRAYRSNYWIVHSGFGDELEQLATEYVVEAGAGSTADPAL
jgi:hypothetical protein